MLAAIWRTEGMHQMNFTDAATFIGDFGGPLVADPVNGIIGLAVGRKDGGPIDDGSLQQFCITAFVVRKLSLPELYRRGMVPAAQAIAAIAQSSMQITSQDVNVEETGDEFRLQPYNGSSHANPACLNTQKWFEKLRPGISIANPEQSYPNRLVGGSAGFFVKDGAGTIYLVSCNHVIARERVTGALLADEPIVQPATMDLSGSDLTTLATASDIANRFQIATLSAFVGVDVHTPGIPRPPPNYVDAALAEVHIKRMPHSLLDRLPYGGRLLGEEDFAYNPATGQFTGSTSVFKCGRTTGYTEGVITGVRGYFTVNFAGQKATFVDQLSIKPAADNTGPFSENGDSGSPVINESHKLVGLLFAGSPQVSWANPIRRVLVELASATTAAGRPVGMLNLV